MGCGPAYYSGYGVAPGAYLAPFYFGTRPNPVRPAVVPPTFTPENVKLRYPPYVYDEPRRSTDTQFWRGSLDSEQQTPALRRRPVQDRRVVCGIDSHAQRWSNGNLTAARPFAYQLTDPRSAAAGPCVCNRFVALSQR